MNRSQLLTILAFLSLFLVLYFGCNTKTKDQRVLEKSRAQNLELVSVDRLIPEAKQKLTNTYNIDLAEEKVKRADSDSTKVKAYEVLASNWFSEDYPLISAYYAEKIAELKQDARSWSLAGTTYSIAAQRSSDELHKKHGIKKAREALEMSLSIDTESVDNKINLALTYVEQPLEDNPMKGVLMLLDLNKKHPENVPVLMQLGRLGMKTGQFSKAVERFRKVIELRPSFREAHCFLAEALKNAGNTVEAEKEQQICDTH